MIYTPREPTQAPALALNYPLEVSATPPTVERREEPLMPHVCWSFYWTTKDKAATCQGTSARSVLVTGYVPSHKLPIDPDSEQAVLTLVKNGRGLTSVALTSTPAKITLPKATFHTETFENVRHDIYPVLLERTGIASWRYLNRRRPVLIALETNPAYLRFRNNIPDHTFVVTFSGIPDTERAELVRQGIKVDSCQDSKCQAMLRVPPGSALLFPLQPLRNMAVKGGSAGVVTFQVSFFDEDTTPTSWSGGATATYARDPDMSAVPFTPKGFKSPVLQFATPWERINRTHLTGSATLNVKQTMGTRADMEVELTVKRGDFGQDASVQPSKYVANAYAVYLPLTLTAGRYDLAAPTSAIAFSESGDAVSGTAIIPGNIAVGIGRIFHKDIASGSFTADDVAKVVQAGGTAKANQSGGVGLLTVSYTNLDSKIVQGRQGVDWVVTVRRPNSNGEGRGQWAFPRPTSTAPA